MTQRILTVAAATVVGLGLSACSTADDAPSEPEASVDEQPSTTEEPTDEAEADSGEPETSEPDVAAAGECLIGEWEMTQDSIANQTASLLGEGAEVTAEGYSRMVFDGTEVTTDGDLEVSFSMSFEGQEAAGTTQTDATVIYAYSVTGDQISFDELISAQGSVISTTTKPVESSNEIDIADTAGQTVGTSQTFTCDANELVLTVESADLTISQTFERR